MPRKASVAAVETTETTAIVLRIAADQAKDFEAMFQAEEIPIWEDFAHRGRFLEARLVRAVGGSEQRGGIQDYILHIVAADHEAHEEHDSDPRFRAFLAKAERLQPNPPLVWFGDTIFERRGRADDARGGSMISPCPTLHRDAALAALPEPSL